MNEELRNSIKYSIARIFKLRGMTKEQAVNAVKLHSESIGEFLLRDTSGYETLIFLIAMQP